MSERSKLLGDLLATQRKGLGYSMRAVTQRCERPLSVAHLQKLERGQVESPSPHILHDLAHALQIPYTTLMEAAGYVFPCGNEKPEPGALTRALLDADDLTPQQRAEIDAYLAAFVRAWREVRRENGEPNG